MGAFESFSAFLQMDGHALYVWLSYGVFAVVMVALMVGPQLRKKQFIRDQLQKYRRESA